VKCAATAQGGQRYQGAAGHKSSIARAKGKIDRQFWRDFQGKRYMTLAAHQPLIQCIKNGR